MVTQDIRLRQDQIPTDLLRFFEPALCSGCYVCHIVEIFREARRVLRKDGTLWLNLGDSYATGGGKVGNCPGGGKQGENWKGTTTSPNRLPLPGLKPKDLIGIPWKVAFALQADGWWLRSDIIWNKPNPMPESVTDRPTKSHEYIFLLAKSAKYYYDAEAIKEPFTTDPKENYPARARITGRGTQGASEARGNDRDKSGGFPPKQDQTGNLTYTGFNGRWNKAEANETIGIGRNKRSVWTVATYPVKEAHFATYPPDLIEPCILAGCPEGGVVLDPFSGSGTTGLACLKHGRRYVGIELNPEYIKISQARLEDKMPLLAGVPA